VRFVPERIEGISLIVNLYVLFRNELEEIFMHHRPKKNPFARAARGMARPILASGKPRANAAARFGERPYAVASDLQSVLLNIIRFGAELQNSATLQKRLAYARCWYACQDNEGHWQFGPSRFVGYDGMTADSYVDIAEGRDGCRAEAQLQQWFTVVDPASKLHSELGSALYSFLAMYGKAPSTKMRISVPNDFYETAFGTAARDAHDVLVDTIVAAANTISGSE
jgi:hypothetical protein